MNEWKETEYKPIVKTGGVAVMDEEVHASKLEHNSNQKDIME